VERVPRTTIVVSRDDLCLIDLIQLIGPASPFGNSRETFRKSGTDGSNPVPFNGESAAKRGSGRRHLFLRRRPSLYPAPLATLAVGRRRHEATNLGRE
jgi:hypothetical protein